MAVSVPAIHEVLPQDTMMKILSYQNYYDLSHFLCASKSVRFLREVSDNSLERSLFSRVEIFDRITWMEYRNAEITDKYDAAKIEIRTLRAFMQYYWGPNPVGPGRVKDNCLVPTVLSKKLKVQGIQLHNCLNVAEFLAQRPKEGPAAKFEMRTKAIEQHGNAGIENDELVVYLKGVYARGESWETQVQFLDKLGDKFEKPKILPQVTVLFAHFQLTGERAFGDRTGMEKRYTAGRTCEEVSYEGNENTYQVVSGCFSEGGQALGPLGGPAPAELSVDHGSANNAYECYGVGVVRKF
jgi:hypothetical protein